MYLFIYHINFIRIIKKETKYKTMLRYVMRVNITLDYCWRSEGVTKCDTGIPARPQKTPAPQKSKISDDKEDKIM